MSSFRLSAADVLRLERAAHQLLTPLSAQSLDAWRARVTHEIGELLGADKATLILPIHGEAPSYSEGKYPLCPEFVVGYLEALNAHEQRFGLWRKMSELGAFSRAMLYSPAVYRSRYYRDWIIPARAYDSVGLGFPAGPERVKALLLFHHDRPCGRRFGARGVALLRFLLPSFRVGIETWIRLSTRRDRLAVFIDTLSEALVIIGSRGRPIHANAAAGRLLGADPYANRLDVHFADLASSVSRVFWERAGRTDAPLRPERMVRTPFADYRLFAFAPPPEFGGDELVLVRIEVATARSSHEPAAEIAAAELRERYRLTRREIVVARLLAARRTNAEIAAALCISSHTALRHTENIRAKLGIASRRQVADRLRGSTEPGRKFATL